MNYGIVVDWRWTEACAQVCHDGNGGITDAAFPGKDGFREAGHSHNIASPRGKEAYLGWRLEPRSGDTHVRAGGMEGESRICGCCQQGRPQLRTVGIAEICVSARDLPGRLGRRHGYGAEAGEVNEVAQKHQAARGQVSAESPYRIGGEDAANAPLGEGGDIRPVVDLMGKECMVTAVSGKKDHIHILRVQFHKLGGAVSRADQHRLRTDPARDRNARSCDDGDFGHEYLPGRMMRACRKAAAFSKLLGNGWPYGFIALFVAGVLYPFVFCGKCLYWGDLSLYFYPQYQVVARSIHSGRLPLWNPYVNCGQPLLGNPQCSVFYPTTLLYLLWAPWRAYTLVVLAHLWLAGWGTYLYLMRLTGDRWAALVGGILFCTSGYLAARLQFPTMVQSMGYIPWILWLVDRVLAEPRVWNGILFCATVALLLAAGHAQVAYMTLACVFAYAAARLWQIRGTAPHVRAAAGMLGWGLVAALAVNAAQLLPTLQLFRASTRTHLTWAETNRFVLLPEQLLNFVLPRFYGDPARGDYWGAGNAWEPCVYIGIPGLCLALFALVTSRGRLAARFYGWLAVLSLLLALGRYGGLFMAAYYLVPGISTFHDPARFAFLTTFALCILAGLGMRRLGDMGISARVRAIVFAVSCMQPAILSGTFNPGTTAAALGAEPAFVEAVANVRRHRVYSAQHRDVWLRYVNYTDYGPSNAATVKQFADTLEPNLGMRFGISEASGYEPVPVRWVAEVDGLVRSAFARHQANLPELLKLFDVRWLLLPQGTRYRHPGLAAMRVPGVAAYEVTGVGESAWTVRRTVRVDGSDRSLAAISEPGFDPLRVAVVSGSPGLDERGASLGEPQPPPAAVRVWRDGPSFFSATVEAGPYPAFLVRSAAAYPGWRAWVDGRVARVEVSDHAFQGVAVPAGRHKVEFRYEPDAFRTGMFVTLAACGTLAGLTAYGWREHVLRVKEIGSGQSNINNGQARGCESEEGQA